MAKKWYQFTAKQGNKPPEILIYEEIGMWGTSAQDFYTDLKALGLKPGDEAVLRLNTPGGDCFAGNAIFNMLADTEAKWTIYIDGVAASMGSLIAALPGAHVIIAANAYIMIHNPAAWANGESKDMARTAKLLDSIRESMAAAYVAKSGMDLDEVKAMMDEETWLDADEAVRLGFADEKGEENRLAAKFDLAAKFKDIPAEVAETLGKAAAIRAKAPKPKESDMDKNELVEALAANNKTLADSIVSGLTAALAPKPKSEAETAKDAFKAYTAEVNGVCKLAGFPEAAAEFIDKETPMAEVRAKLAEKQAAAKNAPAARGARRPAATEAPVTGNLNTHGSAGDDEEDISDLCPPLGTAESNFKKFHGKYHGRAH